MAMLLASFLSVLIFSWAAWFSVQVLRHWDISSGHARQLVLERRTYLVSTALVFVMTMELASLLLFVFNADKMAVMFVGAMCAVGTLNVNDYGFPALVLKITVFFGAATWLIINHADGKGRDYPLTRFKYGFLLLLTPVVIAAAATQLAYFLNLDADVMTSCCSQLFTPETRGLEARLSSADPEFALYLLFGALILLGALAGLAWARQKGYALYALASIVFFVISIIAIVSVISSYIYEQPHHHCPFCILKPEYDYIGYWLYLPLFGATAFGLAAGLLALRPTPASLERQLPAILRRNVAISAGLFILFAAIALIAIGKSHLSLFY
jgi:hypothetical protein